MLFPFTRTLTPGATLNDLLTRTPMTTLVLNLDLAAAAGHSAEAANLATAAMVPAEAGTRTGTLPSSRLRPGSRNAAALARSLLRETLVCRR